MLTEGPSDSLRRRLRLDYPSAIVVNGFDGDGRLWVLDEFYKTQSSAEDLIVALDRFAQFTVTVQWLLTNLSLSPLSSLDVVPEKGIKGFDASPYEFKREDGLRELGARFIKAGDGRPRFLFLAIV